jgi:hypothetical protein
MINTIFYIAKADFLHRIRSYSFLITLAACLLPAYASIPTQEANYYTVSLGDYLFVYNSPAIGTIMTLICSVFLGLFGFYLVNNSIHRDFHTGVGQILATTQLTKFQYLVGKWLSNFSVLVTILLGIYTISIIAFYHKGEVQDIEPIKQLLPFIFMGFPAFAFIAALAVLGEVFIKINKGIINIIYFFIWISLLISNIKTWEARKTQTTLSEFINTDYIGVGIIFKDAEKVLLSQFPINRDKLTWSSGIRVYGKDQKQKMKKFVWQGHSWDFVSVAKRMIWLLISLGLLGIASIFFKRFDPSGVTTNFFNKKKKEKIVTEEPIESKPLIPFSQLPKAQISFNFLALVKAELKIMLWGSSRWWLLVAVGLWVATIFVPLVFSHQFLLPTLYIWFVLIWSNMGTREKTFETNQYLFSAISPLSRQLPAQLVAGLVIATMISLPVLLRQVINVDFAAVYGIVVAIIFIPSFALCLGVWTQGSKFFEVFFVIWFYLLLNNAPFADFVGAGKITQTDYTHIYMLISLVAIVLSFIGRRKQLYV